MLKINLTANYFLNWNSYLL